jgi:radical SAM enzyme (TIGR01210 family)
LSVYPETGRTAWILSKRGPRNPLDPRRAFEAFVEKEPSEDGRLARVFTLFLTNRECPWRCLMCDLWKNTLRDGVEPGAIPGQIRDALKTLDRSSFSDPQGSRSGSDSPRHLKLYNSGSFFDSHAIPVEDYSEIAELGSTFDRVIVECHPRLIGTSCVEFRELLEQKAATRGKQIKLEIALGLETAHPQVLEKLNKKFSLEDFSNAANFLREHGIPLRVFLLIQPPFLSGTESEHWTQRSVDTAFDAGASVVSLIPTRAGNGAMEELLRSGEFTPPTLGHIEEVLDRAMRSRRGRVFVDLWELQKFSDCPACFAARNERLGQMNRSQQIPARIPCGDCAR